MEPVGQTRKIIDLTVFNEDPRTANRTAFAIAARVLGFKFSSKKPFYHELQKVEGRIVRRVAWTFLDEVITVAGERINFHLFFKRITDDEWLKANPEHPLTVAFFAALAMQNVLDPVYVPGKAGLVNSPPVLKVPGKLPDTFAYIPVGCSAGQRAEILEDFELAPVGESQPEPIQETEPENEPLQAADFDE